MFERTRKNKSGGGLMTAVDETLKPVLVTEGEDNVEILTVEALVGSRKVRIINGYGPQEDDELNNIFRFWQEIEEEIIKAKDSKCFVLLQMDANAKIGKDYIKGDPHTMSSNGRLFLDVSLRQHLVIANTLDFCEGVITRERKVEQNIERSVIDYIAMCEDMYKHLKEIKIDDKKVNVLSRYVKSKTGRKIITSDHNPLYARFDIRYSKMNKKVRKEAFKFKCEESKDKFLNETSKKGCFSSYFRTNESFEKNANKFFKKRKQTIHKCFPKF